MDDSCYQYARFLIDRRRKSDILRVNVAWSAIIENEKTFAEIYF